MSDSFRAPRVLGVGFPYLPALPPAFYRDVPLDFVEITPEELCREQRALGKSVLSLSPRLLAEAREAWDARPIVVHGVELSIGSAHGWNAAYLELLDALYAVWPFEWHSEHLGFQTVLGKDGKVTPVGVPMPMPFTEEAANLVGARARELQERYGVPFLLENPAHYLPEVYCEAGLADESAFMARVLARGGCGQLLDLHNVHCNAVNHGFDAFLAVGRLPLERVVEIHLAGGAWRDGFRMDSHSDRVPEEVWELFDFVLPRVPNLAGVVYEVLPETSSHLSCQVIAGELERLHEVLYGQRPGLA
jgi:uncharacterized protein (UPF0276 family)